MAGKRKGKRSFGSVRQLESGRWQASYTHPVTKKRVNAPKTFERERGADQWLNGVDADITRGVLQAPTQDTTTLAGYVETWFKARSEPLRPSSETTYRIMLRLHILPFLGDRPMSSITATDVREWYAKLGETRGAATRGLSYTVLKAIMATYCDDNDLANPCRIKGGGSYKSAETAILDAEEIEAVARILKPRYYAMMLVAAYGQLRIGELRGLRRCDVDTANRRIMVDAQLQRRNGQWVREDPKTDAGRRPVNLPKAVMREVAKHLLQYVDGDPEASVFTTSKGGPVDTSSWNGMLKRAGAKIGRPDIHSHVARHSGATIAGEEGAPLATLMKRLGHSDMKTALRYQHASDKRDRELAESLDNVIAARAGAVKAM